jgi:hypothetical protein
MKQPERHGGAEAPTRAAGRARPARILALAWYDTDM